ncbi:unnamed protein product [Linum tenue]|uniref:DUF4378 domain-containing protein n=1 Tax=Linum tenue TaxID=586396 RepID=A0AAV0S132_9ROSI|nr:unnamed protein product [Linum tenue]
MRMEREGGKNGGGYTGGFFQLFDWSAKSRKKLFSSKSDLPERSKQGKRSDGNLPTTRLRLMDDDEHGGRPCSIRSGGDYSCASSVTDEDGYGGARPAGAIARLMGLDSMPTTSSFLEPKCTTAFSDTQSLRESSSHSSRKQFAYYHHDYHSMYSGDLPHRPQKAVSRPMEKFQTEVLPPKSAKSIPITHHKLLSPIKSAHFVPSHTAAHIMEAAAKIIESSPRAPPPKPKLSSSSSAPLKVRNLKSRLETRDHVKEKTAVRKLSESNAAKCLKGQPMNKSWNGSTVDAATTFRVSQELEEGSSLSSGQKSRGKSVSLAVQAKVNVQQRREGLNSRGNRGVEQQQQQKERQSGDVATSQQPFRSQQPNFQKNSSQRSASSSPVLRQNNQKQNCSMEKDKSSPKPSISSVQGRKVNSVNPYERPKASGKSSAGYRYGSRKSGTDEGRSSNYTIKNTPPRKKRLIDNMSIDRSPTEEAENFTWAAEESKRKGSDVVSFTFTTPLARSSSMPETPNRSKRLLVDAEAINLSSGGDALTSLLEQKLRELTDAVESSRRNTISKVGSADVKEQQKQQQLLCREKVVGGYGANSFSPDPVAYRFKPIFQQGGVDAMEECSSSSSKYYDAEKLLDCRRPSPISVLDHSFSTESSCTLESMDSSSTEGKQCSSSIQAQEVLSFTFPKKRHQPYADAELLDSASSTSSNTLSDFNKQSNWEGEYVKKMLVYLDLMFHDFAIGRSREVVNPHLFIQIEKDHSDQSKLEKKALFDCVSECLDWRCRRYINGGYKAWEKGVTVMRRKDWLAEEVQKEIVSWRKMGDCMVDELVNKDMGSQYGNWLDYEEDAFGVVGEGIEGLILDSLVDELVADIQKHP